MIINIDTLAHPKLVKDAPIGNILLKGYRRLQFLPSLDTGYQLRDYQDVSRIPQHSHKHIEMNIQIRIGWSAWTCCSQCCCRDDNDACGDRSMKVNSDEEW